ncbi:hypothetical protein FACS189490_00780 [Clostridia bacterium]|nr:hypothetical protein FACS189490_00780 [Clostridia bacterium]
MGGFFSMDGPFYRFGALLADVLWVSVLWIAFSIPIVTMGASTTAVFYVMTRRAAGKEQYIFRDFFASFKRNFKVATPVFLCLLLISVLLIINIMNIGVMGNMAGIMLPIQYCVLLEVIFVSLYIFPVLSRFDMKFTQLFKSAFFMANRHLLTTVLCLAALIAVILAVYLMPILFFVAMGLYSLATSYLFIKRFKKYRPEIDAEVDYEALREKLRQERADESGEQTAEDAPVFSDAAGLLIERRAADEAAKEKKRKGKFNK